MEIFEIEGVAQTSLHGATHAIDKDGNTFCGTVGGDGRMFNDRFVGLDFDCVHADDITCKRCLKKFFKEL